MNRELACRDLWSDNRKGFIMFNKIALASVIAALGSTMAVSAYAEETLPGTQHALHISHSPIVVNSDGKNYTTIRSGSAIKMETHQDLSANSGRVKSWKIVPYMVRSYGLFQDPVIEFPAGQATASYPAGNRPQTVKVVREVTIPLGDVITQAIGQCNAMAEALRNEGKTDAQIFKKDRVVGVKVSARGESKVVGAVWSNFVGPEPAVPKTVNIRCAKNSTPSASDTLAGGLAVVKATQNITQQNTQGGHCAVKLVTAISTNKANATVKYQFQHSSGKKSKVFTTKTKGNKIAVVTHTWDIPNKPGTEVGWFITRGVNVKFNSNKSGYTMKCTDGVGGLAQKPGKPKVNERFKPVGGLSN